MSDITVKFKDKPGWVIKLLNAITNDDDTITADNFLLTREDGRYYHGTLVECKNVDFTYYQPLFIEHGNEEKVGDIVIVFRKNPHTHRWMIQVDEEDGYITETEIKSFPRAIRSSLDNIKQSVGRKIVMHVGYIFANLRRIGGKWIAQHYVLAGWATQKPIIDSMMDVFEFARTTDALAHSAILKALIHMPHKTRNEILGQMCKPPEDLAE